MSSLLCQIVALGESSPDEECLPPALNSAALPDVIKRIIQKLPDGAVVTRWVDGVMGECSHMMDLRRVISDKKRLMDRSWNDWNEWSRHRDKYVSFSERYLYLIFFGQYVWAEIKTGAAKFPKSHTGFQDFMRNLQDSIS